MYQQCASKWGAPKVHECLVGQFTIFNSGLGPLKAWWSLWFFEVELTSQNFILSTASLWNIVKQVPWFPVYWLVDFYPVEIQHRYQKWLIFLNVSVSPFEYGDFGYPHQFSGLYIFTMETPQKSCQSAMYETHFQTKKAWDYHVCREYILSSELRVHLH